MGDTRSRLPPTVVHRRDCCIIALRGSIALFSEVPKGHTRLRVLCSGANAAGRALRSTLLRWRHSLAERAPSFFPLVSHTHSTVSHATSTTKLACPGLSLYSNDQGACQPLPASPSKCVCAWCAPRLQGCLGAVCLLFSSCGRNTGWFKLNTHNIFPGK